MANQRPRKHSGLVASVSLLLVWALTPIALAANPPQLERCYQELAILSKSPLRTLDRYPAYLLQRLENHSGSDDSIELAQCERRLSSLVAENRELYPGLLNRLCSQSEQIPPDYSHLQTYLRGIPSLQCANQWFDALTPGQWQQLQPDLARISQLEYYCTQALEALAVDSHLRKRMAEATQRLMAASRLLFTPHWRNTLSNLPADVSEGLLERERQLQQCERLLTGRLSAIDDE